MGAPHTLPADFQGWDKVPSTLPPDFAQWDDAKHDSGLHLSNPSTVPNARIRNLPDPAKDETSAVGALYHGAKTGLLLGSIPASPGMSVRSLIAGTGGGVIGSIAGKGLTKAAGGGDLAQEVGGDVGGVAGAGLAAGVTEAAAAKARAIYNSLPAAVQREMVGIISPRAAHALRIADALGIGKEAAANYPGARFPEAPPQEVLQAASLYRGTAPVTDPAAGLGRVQQPAYQQPVYPGARFPETPAPEILQSSSLNRGPRPMVDPAAGLGRVPQSAYQKPVYPGAPLPEAPPAEVLQAASLYRGASPVMDRAAGLGEIPVAPGSAGSMVQSVAPKVTPKLVEQQLNDSLGGRPLQPGVPLRLQVPEGAKPKLPEGFTPLESSALKGFKYDPAKREFESITQGGQHYIYGDVSPQEVEAFENADSKGKAWTLIRNNTLVAKVVNGKRMNIKPISSRSSGDLTDILEQSLAQVQAKKDAQ